MTVEDATALYNMAQGNASAESDSGSGIVLVQRGSAV
jgi:hypothetical protein